MSIWTWLMGAQRPEDKCPEEPVKRFTSAAYPKKMHSFHKYPVRLTSAAYAKKMAADGHLGWASGACPIGSANSKYAAESLYASWGYKFEAEFVEDDRTAGWWATPGV